MMDLDQSFLSELPLQQRQKVCQQIRQKQIEKFLEFEKSDRARELDKKPCGKNKRGTTVTFTQNLQLQDAVDCFDDRAAVKLLNKGSNSNFVTGNGTSLLHKCAAEDNVSGAELLLSHGADVNIVDDDWWTPLHTACSCDSVEVAQLLLNNGADILMVDVDGYFPVDHASDGSEVKSLVLKYQENKGISPETMHHNRQTRAQDFLNHIKGLPLAVDVNQLNANGVTLLHMAAANGYRSCMKALFKYEPDVNRLDQYGWTPLHVAARYNQTKAVEMLLKHKANPNIADSLGCKPSAITSSDTLRGLLMRFERKQERKASADDVHYMEVLHDENHNQHDIKHDDNIYHEIADIPDDDVNNGEEGGQIVGIFRINSKTVRTKHVTISKEDELLEARKMQEAMEKLRVDERDSGDKTRGVKPVNDDDEDDDDDYVSAAIWKTNANEKGDLVPCMSGDNLVTMATIQEDTILVEVQTRYVAHQIYTYVGDILLAVNPFKEMTCYTKDISTKYHSNSSGSPLPPHIYGIAENSYVNLMHDGKSQCHVISGESGSGKTETCKYIVQHLLRVAGSEETNLNSKINQVNPLLEAFGNAQTVMNNNSSRFGKYVELHFTANGKVVGGKISEYLLEKSRVVHQGQGESNFHMFYWMMAGLSPEEIKVYKLEDMKHLRYLSSSKQAKLEPGVLSQNKAKFWEVKECLKSIGFSTADIQNMMVTLSTVLHLGEIVFHGVGNNEAAQVTNIDMLTKVSEMLEVSVEELGSALVADYTLARGEQIKKERTVQQAEDCRDALAKTLYGRLFSWLVNGINQLIQPANLTGTEQQIGILDIFGFENFPQNSFEQICINVANEQIQMYTNDHIFYKEQQDCLLEGVPLVELNYSNNQPILDLFLEKHTGVLAILDEESNFPKATDKSLATKLHQNSGKKHHQYYKTPKDGGLCFTVIHYAGSVKYNVVDMLEKNRDTLPNSIVYTMKASNRLLIKELFQSRVTRTGSLAPSARQQRSRRTTAKKASSPFDFFKKLKGGNNKENKKPQRMITAERKGPSTMAYHFRNSLNDLISKLQSASPHFVRCIKPNSKKASKMFVPEYVLAQLRYTGISDIVKIRKFGYASRLTYHEFLQRYPVLVQCCLPQFCPMTEEKKCQHVLQHYKIPDVKYGKNKMFMKTSTVEALDHVTSSLEVKVTRAQSVIRGFLGRQKSKKVSAQKAEQNKALSRFVEGVNNLSDIMVTRMGDSVRHDREQRQLTLKKKEISEITKSLEALDDIIDHYDMAGNEPVFYEEPEMNGQMHQRGLPPTPTQFDPSRPPPCPREMYGGDTNMYHSIQDDQVEYRKQAPPPPRRNPETRLSTASVSSNSSQGTYEEVHVEENSPHHHQHHSYHQQTQQQQYYRDQPSSPRHTTHGSPSTHPKFHHGPQSPQSPQSPSHVGNRPFSYGAGILSPKLKPANPMHSHSNGNVPNRQNGQNNQNGHSQQHVNAQNPILPNYQYEEQSMGSPAANYGRHESAFHPQPHRPAPAGPPPPPPPGGDSQGHYMTRITPQPHQSPKLPRHSVDIVEGSLRAGRQRSPCSPRLTPKLSQRSQSVPSEHVYLPEPPPPVTMREGYLAAALESYRPPSPDLPPPPPELLQSSTPPPPPQTSAYVPQNMQTQYQQQPANQSLPAHHVTPVAPPAVPNSYHQPASPRVTADANAPPPPPISSIPKKQTADGTNTNLNGKGHNSNQPPSQSPPRNQESSPSPNLLGELNKVQLRKTETEAPVPVKNTESPRKITPPASVPVSREITSLSGIKLRPTSARLKLLEKDGLKTSPSMEEEEPISSGHTSSPTPPAQEVVQAPPTQPTVPPPVQKQVSPTVNLFEKKTEIVQPAGPKSKGDTSKNSKMDINLDDIDLNEISGYTPITKSTPVWKRDMIEKKNQEKIEEYVRKKEKERQDAEKWKNVPAWKRKLMIEKEREMEKKGEEQQIQDNSSSSGDYLMNYRREAAEEAANRKKRAKEAEEDKRQRAKEDKERAKEMEEELADVPAWKREVMMKRGGAIKNWGDEREGINDQELEDGEYRPEQIQEEEIDRFPPPPPQQQRQFTQKAVMVLKTQTKEPTPKITQQPPARQVNNNRPPPKRASLDEAKLEEEWDSLPLWKREIMMKRGGAPTNWGNENESSDENDE